MKIWSRLSRVVVLALLVVGLFLLPGMRPAEDHPVTFSGGHDIGGNDHGRPCVLIAAALGVETEVFREAFSGVTPARGRGPSGDEARKNKAALMRVLGPRGVTNDRLDEVSNYYRFQPRDGDLWKHTEAKAHAVVANGQLVRIVVTEAGSGYTTPPKVTVKGLENVDLVVSLRFDKDLKRNGSVKLIEVRK